MHHNIQKAVYVSVGYMKYLFSKDRECANTSLCLFAHGRWRNLFT